MGTLIENSDVYVVGNRGVQCYADIKIKHTLVQGTKITLVWKR